MRQKLQAEYTEIRKQMTDDPEQCMELLLKWRNTNYTELALEIDRNPETISRTVKGKTNPQVETAALICFGADGGTGLPVKSAQDRTSVDKRGIDPQIP